jgi:hypothetical protein
METRYCEASGRVIGEGDRGHPSSLRWTCGRCGRTLTPQGRLTRTHGTLDYHWRYRAPRHKPDADGRRAA